MLTDLLARWFIRWVVGAHFNASTVWEEMEVMRGGVLIEAHRGGAALLHLRFLRHLGEMLLVSHTRRHRRVILSGNANFGDEGNSQDRGKNSFVHHASILKPGV